MQDLTPTRPPYNSPKRKRSDYSLATTSSPSRLKTNLSARPSVQDPLIGEGSPRTTVVSHFENLDLNGPNPVSKHSFRKTLEGSMIGYQPSQRSNALEGQAPPLAPASFPNSEGKDLMTHSTGRSALHAEANWQSSADDARAPRLEIPETPRLKPALSPSPTLSPLLSRAKSPRSASPTLWWTETEITGHDPKDPMDDGYGINGVGFLPTPAIAHARVERRRRQVVEWKNREAREARQKRSEMRRRRYVDGQGLGSASAGMPGGEVRKVRFLEA